MSLMKLEDFYPEHPDFSSNKINPSLDDIKSYEVYAQGDEKVGSMHNILVDDQTGEFRYFVVDTGFWIFGKKVLLPVGLTTFDSPNQRVYALNLTRDQVEALPKFSNLEEIDYDYEEEVRGVYRPSSNTATTSTATSISTAADKTYERDTYTYERDSNLYGMNERDHQTLKLYQERLIANKHRQKTGEVAIGKTVEIETTHVAVPIEKERVVIKRKTSGRIVTDNMSDAFREDTVRMEVYEETPDIRKEIVLREEVTVRKEVNRDTLTADETLRREELNIDNDGAPIDKF
ncbi:DUF2382 domain-containing protein [Leptolyngbya sp. GB1-A1]|uniref:DUF2382 domain-containing protein n=1 Tax=Leptolyngbya sp. GB1-A1 TaxID=2933908 RepID=UPI003296AB5B